MGTSGRHARDDARRHGWTLLEVLLVVGIIAVLISILVPAIGMARRSAQRVRCQSNLRSIGQALHTYAAENGGWLNPMPAPLFGMEAPPHQRWPAVVFKVPAASGPLPYDPASYTPSPYDPVTFPAAPYTPEVFLCPADEEEPAEAHSYILNGHLGERGYKLGGRDLGGRTSADVVLVGEKHTHERDYYLERDEFNRMVAAFRHGERKGSNYLFVDGHVDLQMPRDVLGGIDPWDVVSAR